MVSRIVCVCACVCIGVLVDFLAQGLRSWVQPPLGNFSSGFFLPLPPTSPQLCANSRSFLMQRQWSRCDFGCPHYLLWGKAFLLKFLAWLHSSDCQVCVTHWKNLNLNFACCVCVFWGRVCVYIYEAEGRACCPVTSVLPWDWVCYVYHYRI